MSFLIIDEQISRDIDLRTTLKESTESRDTINQIVARCIALSHRLPVSFWILNFRRLDPSRIRVLSFNHDFTIGNDIYEILLRSIGCASASQNYF